MCVYICLFEVLTGVEIFHSMNLYSSAKWCLGVVHSGLREYK